MLGFGFTYMYGTRLMRETHVRRGYVRRDMYVMCVAQHNQKHFSRLPHPLNNSRMARKALGISSGE